MYSVRDFISFTLKLQLLKSLWVFILLFMTVWFTIFQNDLTEGELSKKSMPVKHIEKIYQYNKHVVRVWLGNIVPIPKQAYGKMNPERMKSLPDPEKSWFLSEHYKRNPLYRESIINMGNTSRMLKHMSVSLIDTIKKDVDARGLSSMKLKELK